MSRNASGTYSLPAGNPVVTNEVISSNWANTTLSDIASALTDSLSRSGLGGMTAPLNLASGLIGAPGLNWSAETTSGLYRAGAGDFRYAIGGADIFTITAAGFAASVIAPITLNVSGAATFTRTWTSGNSGAVTLSAAQPLLEIDQSGAAANQRRWWMTSTGEELLFQAANDARTSATTFMQVTRTNNTADAIAFTSTALTWNGAQLVTLGAANTFTAANTFSNSYTSGNAGGIVLSSAFPQLEIDQSGAAANNRRWWIQVTGEQLQFQAANDARTAGVTWLSVDRTLNVADRVSFPTDSSGVADSDFYVGSDQVGTLTPILATFRTSVASKWALNVVNATASAPAMQVHNQATAGDNTFILFTTESTLLGSQRGTITYNRAGGVVAYNTTCREALKTNIRPCASALNFVKNMSIVAFDWKNSDAKLPYFVTYERTEKLAPWACQNDGVDVSKLVPALYKAVQEIISHLGL